MPPFLAVLGGIVLGPTILALTEPLLEPIIQRERALVGAQLIPIQTLLEARHRDILDEPTFYDQMGKFGLSHNNAERIWEASFFYPTPTDLVNWQAKEVFEPDAIEKYGLDAEVENVEREPFAKAGMTEEQVVNYWRAHWQHPPFNQVATMLHRDTLTNVENRENIEVGSEAWATLRKQEKDALFDYYKLVEIPPYWRDKLTQLSQATITRVDARRMYDMRVIDETQLLRIYVDNGYDIEDAKALVLWTKVFVDLPVLLARYRNGWVQLAEVKSTIIGWGVPGDRADQLIQEKVQNLEQPTRVEQERDLTKSEIVKGVKKGHVPYEVGVEMLEGMGYDNFEADYIMMINIETDGSPETRLEYQKLVESYRKSQGQPFKEIPADVIKAEKRLEAAKTNLDTLRSEGAKSDKIDAADLELTRAKHIYRTIAHKFNLLPPESKPRN